MGAILTWLLRAFWGTATGRWTLAGFVALIGGAFLLWRHGDALREKMDGHVARQSLERVENAIRAGDAVPVDPDRLRDPQDRNCRDCGER